MWKESLTPRLFSSFCVSLVIKPETWPSFSLLSLPLHVTNLYYFLCTLIFFVIYWHERETLICCFTHLCIHQMMLTCALTRDQTCNPGASGSHCKQLSYPARTFGWFLYLTLLFYLSCHGLSSNIINIVLITSPEIRLNPFYWVSAGTNSSFQNSEPIALPLCLYNLMIPFP